MLSRRLFFKKLLFGGIASGLVNFKTDIAKSSELFNLLERNEPTRNQTIFCIVDDPVLKDALKNLARELNCDVLFDWPNSPELIFDHHFVAVVDGNYIEERSWDLYVECCDEGDILAPCLIFGETAHLNMPERANISIFDSDNAHEDIINKIKELK